jgi:hypothetical protein
LEFPGLGANLFSLFANALLNCTPSERGVIAWRLASSTVSEPIKPYDNYLQQISMSTKYENLYADPPFEYTWKQTPYPTMSLEELKD